MLSEGKKNESEETTKEFTSVRLYVSNLESLSSEEQDTKTDNKVMHTVMINECFIISQNSSE